MMVSGTCLSVLFNTNLFNIKLLFIKQSRSHSSKKLVDEPRYGQTVSISDVLNYEEDLSPCQFGAVIQKIFSVHPSYSPNIYSYILWQHNYECHHTNWADLDKPVQKRRCDSYMALRLRVIFTPLISLA